MSDFQFRFVVVRGVRYLRLDDVASFIRELGSTEETDVRNRLNEAATNFLRAQAATAETDAQRGLKEAAADLLRAQVKS